MQISRATYFFGLLVLAVIPASATVTITSLTSSPASPQNLGTTLTFNATATSTNAGILAFQFNVAFPTGAPFVMMKDYLPGTFKKPTWTAHPFVWTPTGIEGTHAIEVVAKNFTTGEITSQTIMFTLNPLVTGSTPVVVPTTNALVALFSAPSCPSGSTIRVTFQDQAKAHRATQTPYQSCHPPFSMNFEIAGMYPSTPYNMFSQTLTGTKTVNGPTVTFTTGAVPTNVPVPTFTEVVPPGSNTDRDALLVFNPIQFGGGTIYSNVAVDLSGNVVWYYYASPPQSTVLTRVLPNGTVLTLQMGTAWDPSNTHLQFLRQTDLAGNIIKETNAGAIQQELLALGVTDAAFCATIAKPAPVGSGCLDGFNHDAIETLPNGDTGTLVKMEKIFAPGTQGDTSGLPVDIVGDMVLVLDANWQVIWYFDSYEHDGGAPQLDINRPAVLGETCSTNTGPVAGCPPLGLTGPGIAPMVPDWLHGNSLYYWPQDKDLIWSVRNQDWIAKIDYNNGAGTSNILWRLGPCGDFGFNNIYNDPWPWNSAQHEVGIENNGKGPMTLFDNGNTRVSAPGASTGCMQGVGSGNSRGMALTVDESTMQVTPVLSADLGYFSNADGSAQLLDNGNYFYLPATVVNMNMASSNSIEILPTAGTDTGTPVLNLQSTSAYRAFRMPNMYSPPTT